MAWRGDAPGLFHIHAQQITRRLEFEAYNGLLGVDCVQARQAQLRQHAADGGNAAADHLDNAAHRHALASKALDALR